jgi:nucleotidyltransferase substrate binding protein (TIGR01987 family)
MSEETLMESLESLSNALDRFGEALARPDPDDIVMDATIQRFEFTFELFWKVIRRLLARQGIEANSPKTVLQQAYRLGWLEDEQKWLKLLEDRNLTSHTYRETLAREIYSRIPDHHAAMRDAVRRLRTTA